MTKRPYTKSEIAINFCLYFAAGMIVGAGVLYAIHWYITKFVR